MTSVDGNGTSAVAIGSAAKATSYRNVAIGALSQATAIDAVAIGDTAVASAVNTTSVGAGAQATSVGSLAAGSGALANNQYTIALGNSAQATNLRAMAVGYGAVASGGGAIALGRTSQATASYATSLGYENTASGASSLSVGYHTYAYGTRSIAIGREAVSGVASTDANPASNTIALGYQTSSLATDATAIGTSAAANVASSVALGSGSTTTRATDSNSSGWNAQNTTWTNYLTTKGNEGTTSGGVWNSSAGVVSIGTDGSAGTTVTRKLTGLAAGQYDTDAVNMAQWTNTMLATTGDVQASGSTQYGTDGKARTATKLLNESLNITGGGTSLTEDDLSSDANIGTVISDNQVTLRLAKDLTGLETISLTNPTTGNSTVVSGDGITITPSSGDTVSLTNGGLNNGGNKITNVATGTAGTDAVNVDQLNQAISNVTGGSGTTTTVTVEGGTAAGTNGTYTGNNLQVTETSGTGTKSYDLKLADNVTLGSTDSTGTSGSMTVNGNGGSSVAIDGATGSVALTGTDGSTATIAAGTAANDVNGNSLNRITVGGATVATLDDGMVYTGDTGTAAVKLNKTVNIVGGETDSSKLSTDNNIGIVAAQDGENGKLTVRLAKDITGLNTVTAGTATLGNQTEATEGGVAEEGSYLTGLENTTWDVTNPDIVSGRAATEDQLKIVSNAVTSLADGTSANATGGFGLTDDNGTAVKQDLGKTIQIAGDGNITTTADATNTKLTVGLSNTVAVGTAGSEDGSLTVNGAAGSSVAIDGSDGSIDLTGTDGSTATIAAGTSAPNLAGTSINRITVGGATVATLDDGMKYNGDFGSVASVKLNNQVNVKGEATSEDDLTTGNIGVVSSQDGDNALLTVKLNKDLNLGSTGSVTMGNTVINNDGVTIGSGTTAVSLTDGGLNNGGNKITNVATGTDGTDAVNVDQLKEAIAGISGGSGTKTSLTVEGGTVAGTDGTYTGSNLQVTSTTGTDGSTTYDMKLADNISLGSANGSDGTGGVDSSITVNGAAGSSVAIDGATGSIGLTGTDGSTATIAAGTSAPNLAGTSIDRITVGGATVATLDDGMKYNGDFGSVASVKLNNQVNVKGEATSEADLTTGNIGVVSSQDGDNALLTVKLNKDINLGETGSVTVGNTVVNNDGVTIGSGDTAVSLTDEGLNNGGNKITNVAAGTNDTDAVNLGQLKSELANAASGVAKTDVTVNGGENAPTDGTYTDGNLQLKATKNGELTTYDLKLADDITLGSANGSDGTGGVDSSITVNGAAGSSVAIDGATGSIGLTGTDGSTATIEAGTSAPNLAGTTIDRITVGGATVATLDDGMKYGGDFGDTSSVKLNNQVNVKGNATTEANLTDGNIGVVSSQDGANGLLTVKLNKDINLGDTGSVTTGATVINNDGVTITPSTGNPVTLTGSGLNNGGNKITNVADGDVNATSTDAVNGSQLQAVKDIAEKHTVVTVEGGTAAGTNTYAGNNLQLKATDNDGQTTYDLKLADTLSLGSANGADGTGGVDGTITLNGADGSTGTIAAGPAADDVNGNSIDRITVGGSTVATLDDGMVYTGDTGTAAVKLNKTVNIVGGETDSSKLSTDNNIGIVAAQDGDNGKLTVRLAKDITGLNTLTAGTATLGNQTEITVGGVAEEGSYVTGLENTTWNMADPDYVSGRAATEDQLKTVTDAVNAISDGTSAGATGGFGLTDDSGTAVKQDLGKTIQVAGDGNITTTADATNGKLTVALSDTIALGEKAAEDGSTEGADSSITVNGKDGSSVAINGADGTIALNTGDGSPVTIAAGTSTPNLAGTTIDRITVGGATVATLDDGMKYGGDFGSASSVKLNNQVNVKGNATTEADLTDGNIGVVSSQDGDNGLLTVKLNKDINLGDTGSVTTGATVINNDGVTITPSTGNPVTLTGTGLNNGGNKITNVANGEVSDVSTDAVNGSQLNEVRTLAGKHTQVTVEGGTAANSAEYVGKNLLLNATTVDSQTTFDLKLADDISLGSANGEDGTGGTDSSITVNGATGSSVAINGADGSIGLTGTDGSTASMVAGPQVNNLAGTAIDRITVGGATVATLDDGMKYGGDFGDTSKVKLNNQVNVKGNAKNEADLTDGNIGVVSSQDGDNGQLLIKLNKDLNLGDTGSVTMGNTLINNSGVTIGSGSSAVTLTSGGLNNGGNQITNVASGTTGTTYDTSVDGQANFNNAANIGDLTTAINDIKDANNGGGFGLTADDGQSVKQDLGSTITVAGDGNVVTSVSDGKLNVGLNKDIDLGSDGSITVGNTVINNDGVGADKITINDSDISIDRNGINAGNTQITNVASGADGVDADGNPTYNTANNAANIGDVQNIANAAADAVKAQSGKNITVGADNTVNLNDNITLGDTTDPSKQVNIDGNGATITAGSGDNQVTVDGSKGQISAGGAVLGNQANTAGDSNPATGNYLTGLDNTTWDGENIQSGRAATEDQLKTVSDKVNKGRVFQGDDGADNSVTVALGDTLKLTGGADSNRLSDGNIGVVRNSSNDGLDIKLAKDLTGLDSVTTGNTSMTNNGITIKTVDSDRNITIQDSNINMGNNVVSGVADGTVADGSTEAINGSQLAQRDRAINNLGGQVNKLDNRINEVGAGAAALAALHPQDFDPDDKWDFAFGYGHYNGANAGALGAFYKPNEDTTFSIGGTIGGGENMINAGVSFKLGQGNNVSNSRVAVAKEVRDLREGMAKLEAVVNNQNDVINRQSELINQLTGKNPGMLEESSELFPDVPDNHWAYEYVNKLHDLGIIEGYPDGNFDGNRMMTRYEFAAVVYRAIMAGAASNAALQGDNTLSRLANEFSKELKYIRIDTVRKDKDGNPTIQRVRIVPENKDKY